MVVDQERRAGARAPLAGTAMVHVRDARVACEILDVGAMGMGLLAPRNVRPGEFVRVVFRLGAANGPDRLHEADGVVVGAQMKELGCRLGIAFTVIEGHVAAQIHDYIAARVPAVHTGRRTGEYAPLGAYPPSEAGDAPAAAKVTAEYPVQAEEEVDVEADAEVPPAATGTDGAPRRREITRPQPALTFHASTSSNEGPVAAPVAVPPSEHDAPIDRELLNLALDAVRTVRTRKRD